MSAVTILAAGAKANSGTGASVDVSAFSTLRLDFVISADCGKGPDLEIFLEQGPSATGPWRPLWQKRQNTATPPGNVNSWVGAERVSISGFDRYMRARWAVTTSTNNGMFGGVPQDSASLNLAITGDGKPDAA